MISSIVSRLVILVFGTLYPAYASYKAVRTKNVKEYVKWMMYWIVFALFTCAETFTDVFLSFWFPFYYEIKIILVLWLLSPATKGSSILYRKFVHPMLSRREQEIDEYIAKAKEQGYHTVLHLGTKGVNYATTVLMQTAIKGGGGLVNQLRRSYSLSDLSSDKESDMNRNNKALKNDTDEDEMEETDGLDPRVLRPRGYSPRRSASGSGRVEMYFPEVDVDVRQHGSSRPREPSIPLSHIRSSEDVSSGYSSAEPLYAGHHATKSEGLAASREPLVRTASVGSTRSMRTKSSRGGVVAKRGPAAEDNEFWDLQGDEADYRYQEEHFYDVSSSQIPAPIPFPVMRLRTPLSTVSEVPSAVVQDQTPPKLNNSASDQEHFEDVSDLEPTSPDENDLPLYDAEADDSNLIIPGSVQFETTHTSVSTSKDMSSSRTTEYVTVPHTDNTVVDTVLSSLSSVSNITDTNTTKDESSKIETVAETKLESLAHSESPDTKELPLEKPASQEVEVKPVSANDKKDIPSVPTEKVSVNSIEDKPIPVNENKIDTPSETVSANSLVVESTPIIDNKIDTPSETVSANSLVVESTPIIDNKIDTPSETVSANSLVVESTPIIDNKTEMSSIPSETAPVHSEDAVSDSKKDLSNFAQPTHTTSEIKEIPSAQESSLKESSESGALSQSQADETVSEITQAAIATSPLSFTSAESLSPDNTMDISSESQDSKYDSGVEHSLESVLEVINAKLDLISKPSDGKPTTETSQNITIDQQFLRVNESSLISGNVHSLNSVEDGDVKHLKDDAGSAYASVESLSAPELPSRSGSQSSLRKEGRGGRYHKKPAPTPPPRTSESEGDNWADVPAEITTEPPPISIEDGKSSPPPKLEKEEISEDVSSPQVTESDDSDAAVTARLVLKPGVVRSVGPDSNTKTEVFVSKTPQSKSKKSKSKGKQGESGFSRFLALPKNLFPFWSGKQDTSTSSSGQGESSSTSASVGSSNSAFAQVRDSKKSTPRSQHKAPLAGSE